MMPTTRDRLLQATVAVAALSVLLPLLPYLSAHAAGSHGRAAMMGGRNSGPASARAAGYTTTWRLTLLRIRSMYRIPHTTWDGYRLNFYRFFVLALRMANTGARAADPYHDLGLTLKVMPPHVTSYIPGFISLQPQEPYGGLVRAAARDYGGVPPWTVMRAGQTTLYCYVIGTNRGESYYGLYNILPHRRPAFLLDTGL